MRRTPAPVSDPESGGTRRDANLRDEAAPDQGELSAVLAAAARGDESAWREVVARYARRVFALARSRVRSPELAEEVTQAVFAKVATTLGSGGYTEVGRFESWLFRIAMNRVRDEARRASRHATPTDPAALAGLGPATGVEASHNGAAIDARAMATLRGALGELPDADREVIELRHHGQMSFKAMADLLGEPLGTLLARHHRALRKLRAIIEASASGVDASAFGRPSESTNRGANR